MDWMTRMSSEKLDQTAKAIADHPEEYAALCANLDMEIHGHGPTSYPAKVDEIVPILRDLIRDCAGTIFYNPYKSLDSGQYGSAESWDREIDKLQNEIDAFNLQTKHRVKLDRIDDLNNRLRKRLKAIEAEWTKRIADLEEQGTTIMIEERFNDISDLYESDIRKIGRHALDAVSDQPIFYKRK